MKTLKKDCFKPTERVVQLRLKSLLSRQNMEVNYPWSEIWNMLSKDSKYVVTGNPPNRVIYMSNDIYGGIDPNEPQTKFSDSMWNTLKDFLREIHPTKKQGRYGFAEFLKDKGPATIRNEPLGLVTELVQVAIVKNLLKSTSGYVCTIGPTSDMPSSERLDKILSKKEQDYICREVITFLRNHSGRAQIGSLSNHLQRRNLMSAIREFGGLKKFLMYQNICDFETDGNNGLYAILKPKDMIVMKVRKSNSMTNFKQPQDEQEFVNHYFSKLSDDEGGVASKMISSSTPPQFSFSQAPQVTLIDPKDSKWNLNDLNPIDDVDREMEFALEQSLQSFI